MDPLGTPQFSTMKKVFLITLSAGLVAGAVFPLFAALIIGRQAVSLPFIAACLCMGLTLGVLIYLFIRLTLQKIFRQLLSRLHPLAGGNLHVEGDTVEALNGAVEKAVCKAEKLVDNLLSSVDEINSLYRSMAESSHYLSERAREGLAAAIDTHRDVQSMDDKQQQITEQMEILSHRTQDESALSRQLFASLEQMSTAIDHSTAQFMETTTSVEEMAASVKEVAGQAEEISRAVEETSHDLDSIGDSLAKIHTGSLASAQAANTVRKDAEDGLRVVRTSIEEMERIDRESQKTREAMGRLSRQTGDVVKIIEVIKELVSDTELLAFNAAIIAAKAGEEGKGFSVVAEEIRDLADRTTTSATDIHHIVKAIQGDTKEMTEAVEATSKRISRGRELSLSTGEALNKILKSSSQAADSSDEIANLTARQGERAKALIHEAGASLRSVRAIARAQNEQQIAISRIMEGVNQMNAAAVQIRRGMEEQVKANREFDRSLAEREQQFLAINEAARFLRETSTRVFAHFARSEQRLRGNADKGAALSREIHSLEALVRNLRQLADAYRRDDED
ncbi:methyl-accepting chemotaxis protein [Desulfuromonas sp. KJ2020]|uniref:methyl-accepting chemotaxis protein n=1 Tax=Desulfuromonas sp. KJ2020 TaxID=2919173 RepID=UPI0020A70733|nr:methyl-accepting chemotaxis protein [Desulfuromonas sp. KJ2020]MCP3176115.1 methyl-accepting chemotaxis protein [Desulfuromonas sp. KJ2020]